MRVMLYCRTYKPAAADPVSDGLSTSNHHTIAAADDDDDVDDVDANGAYYQFPLSVERIYWVDSADSFHSSISHIVQVDILHFIDAIRFISTTHTVLGSNEPILVSFSGSNEVFYLG